MTKPPSLGDPGKKYVLTDETWDPPGSRETLIATFKDIITGGGVQKVVIELGKPIQVKRYVDQDVATTPLELPPDDALIAARNAEIYELPIDDQSAFLHLFQAFLLLSQKRLKATTLLVHSTDELRKWLKIGPLIDVGEVYGVETTVNATLPEDQALLVGVAPGSSDVAFSIRIPMNLTVEKR